MTVSGLETTMREVDGEIGVLEGALREGRLELASAVERALRLVNRLMLVFAQAADHPLSGMDEQADPLEIFKVFVKGDPSLNAVRDNLRELVYYRNCLAGGREDALPLQPLAMTVRTLRHIYLYMRTRAIKEYGLKEA
ncbi:hypothetical protein [Acidiferrobacter sp.]|jgi:hypothetical protein|uniref:hypothetical protein n=1 Tax=Acidiferrobacter sp. TaxID=1872107 RepID=UPI002637B974|nr:hypothetical protein [Acidiferrobacter sp.]